MSLADVFLSDWDDDTENENESPVPVPPMEIEKPSKKWDSIRQIAKLHHHKFSKVLTQIEKFRAIPRLAVNGPLEADPEYQVIVDAKNLSVEVDDEIRTIHKFLVRKYEKRFPELKSVVLGAMEYIYTVKQLRNDLKVKNEDLVQILPPATIIILNVLAFTTLGESLTGEELAVINEACDLGLEMNGYKIRISEYLESRMPFVAPNIVGTSTAAKSLGAAHQ